MEDRGDPAPAPPAGRLAAAAAASPAFGLGGPGTARDPARRDTEGAPRSQAEAILACDFFTTDLLDGTQA